MWRFAAASEAGRAHLRRRLPCQDFLECLVTAGDTFVGAVADGAGCAAMAGQGARIAVRAVLDSAKRALEEGQPHLVSILADAVTQARIELAMSARDAGVEVASFACTLLAVIATPRGGAALQIGDGAIVVCANGSDWCWAFWPQHGEYLNTTHFLTDEDAHSFIKVEPLPGPFSDIALTTDGLEPLALHYATRSVFGPFFDGVFAPLHRAYGVGEITPVSDALGAFLRSERVTERTDDDVSLIIATRRRPAA